MRSPKWIQIATNGHKMAQKKPPNMSQLSPQVSNNYIGHRDELFNLFIGAELALTTADGLSWPVWLRFSHIFQLPIDWIWIGKSYENHFKNDLR